MAAQDIILDNDGDLEIVNGDFVVSFSDPQHLMLLVNFAQGALKQWPLQGAGIMNYSGSTGQSATLLRAIKVAVTSDGYQNVTATVKQEADGTFSYNVDGERT